ncbi:MAG: OmpH family outer membrane protein [Planctomycetota bacterium]
MKKPAMIVALTGALVLGLYVTAGGQSGGEAAPTRVAVVNMQEVINNSDQQAANRAKNQQLGTDLQTEQKERQDAIVKLQNEIDPLEPGGDAWRAKRDQIQQKTLELRVWAEMQTQNNQLEQARQFAVLYRNVNEAAGQVAQEMGYDVVLQAGELPDLMRLNVEQLQSVVQSRKVIYSSDQVDITAAVLSRLNAEFK